MRFKLVNFNRILTSIAAICLVVGVSACGGGGGDGPYRPPSAEGFYTGSLTNSGVANSSQTIILEDDSFWSVYGLQTGSSYVLKGFVQGQGTSSGGSFISNDLRDFGLYPALLASLNATYGGGNIGGTWAYPTYSLGFSGAQPAPSSFNYWQPANLQSITGVWTLTTVSNETLNFNISPTGILSGISGPCPYSGSITPRASGINVFDVTITFTSSSCFLAGQTVRGVAVSNFLPGGSQQLTLAGVDATRTYGLGAVGAR